MCVCVVRVLVRLGSLVGMVKLTARIELAPLVQDQRSTIELSKWVVLSKHREFVSLVV